MKYVVFDIETSDLISGSDPDAWDLAVLCTFNSETNSYESYLKEDLDKLWPILENTDALIGFNSDHFDIPLLNKYYAGDLKQLKSIDLMKTIQESLGRRIGLATVAEATLNVGKSANGIMSVEWWKQGKIQKVIDYCIQDVKVTKDLYEHMRDKKYIKYTDRDDGKVYKIDVDTSLWDKKEDIGITPTLQF